MHKDLSSFPLDSEIGTCSLKALESRIFLCNTFKFKLEIFKGVSFSANGIFLDKVNTVCMN